MLGRSEAGGSDGGVTAACLASGLQGSCQGWACVLNRLAACAVPCHCCTFVSCKPADFRDHTPEPLADIYNLYAPVVQARQRPRHALPAALHCKKPLIFQALLYNMHAVSSV